MRVRRGKAQQVFTGYEGNVFTSFDVNCNDEILCAGTEAIEDDAYLIFWDRRTTNLLGAYKESHSDDVTQHNPFVLKQVKFHPTMSDWLATGSTDGLVCVFDISQSSEEDALVTTLNSESSVNRIGWCGSNSEYLFGLTHTESIMIWDAVESSLLTRFDDVRETLAREDQCTVNYLVDCFYHSSLKSLVVLGGADNGDMQLLTVGRDRLHPVHPLTGSHKGIVRCLHWDNRRECLLTGGEDAAISVWQPEHTPTPTPTNNNPTSSTRHPTSSSRNFRRHRRKLPNQLENAEKEGRKARKAEKRGSPQKSMESPTTPTQPAPEKITKRMQRLKIQHSGKPYERDVPMTTT
ncbi:WD repeat-containing protein 89-like [Amphiura filiformis]|uniref:WD repeat-containing protein 89-like n=1 Tax=Amphiura filiformis TaxID=82378 RepID=UPI003B223F35